MARKLEVAIVGDSSNFRRSLSQAGSGASKFGSTIKKVGLVAAAGLGAGLAVAVVGLKKSFDAAKEAQLAQGRLEAQLQASGIQYEKFRGKIDDVLTSQSRLSAFDDEDLSDSFTNLVRVTGDVNEALRLNALAADFARAKGIDVAKAGELVGKVAGGNLGILSRYGIVLEDGATKQEALAVLQEKFAGQAEAYGSSVAGAGDRVSVAMENIAETIGEMVFPLADKVLGAIGRALEGVQDFADRLAKGRSFQARISIVWEGVSGVVDDLLNKIKEELFGRRSRPVEVQPGRFFRFVPGGRSTGLVETIKETLENADWTEIGQRVGEGISKRVQITADFIGRVLTAARTFIDQHGDEFADLGAKMMLKIISKLLDSEFWLKNWQLILGIAIAVFPIGKFGKVGVDIGRALLRPIAKLLPEGFRTIGFRATQAILGQLGKLPGRAQTVIVAVVSRITATIGRLIAWFQGPFQKLLVDTIPRWIRAAFRLTFFISFVEGIQSGWERVKRAVGSAVDWIVDKLKQIWDWLTKITRPWTIRISIPRPSGADIGNALLPGNPFGAAGGIVTRPTWSLIGERGPEAVIPLNRTPGSRPLPAGGGGGGPGQFALVYAGADFIGWLQEQDKRHRRGNGGRGIL